RFCLPYLPGHPDAGLLKAGGCHPEQLHIPYVPGIMNPRLHTDLSLLKNVKYDDDVIAELKKVLRVHVEYNLGKRLKSAQYMIVS
ncbi:MAG: hypothetical protein R6T98_05730, partial [Desulfatiglandales bacterium]